MDIGKSFSFQFEDSQWISKLGIGAIIAIVPILNFAWSGYMVDIMRNVRNGVTEPLPNWDDIGKKFTEGLILFGAGLVYALPILIVFCLPMGFFGVSGLLSGNNNMQDLARSIAGAGGVLFYCILCIFLVYALALSIIYPAILVTFSREGTFASCFKFRDVSDLISKNVSPFFTAWIVSLVAGLIVSFVVGFVNVMVGWIPCIGWIVGLGLGLASGVYASSVYAHLFGQFGAMAFGQAQLTDASAN